MRLVFLAAAAALSTACSSETSCVARGALVATPKGRRPVEELALGDEVTAVDPASGERVTATLVGIRRAMRECITLTGEGFSLTCTTDHPLYDPSEGRWAPAGDWALGARSALLFVPQEGHPRAAQVTGRSSSVRLSEVFDLTVDHALHNFVADGVLVHNKSRPLEICAYPDAGSSYESAPCTCSTGGSGATVCSAPGGVAVCVCDGADAGRN
ncbi:MAG: extracellular repeat protein [Myxococcaceae bacterium]|nr:extracellular repeat protein [Myxococcaceae bacterium]